MKYPLNLSALILLLTVVSAANADTYTVSGEVQYTGTGLLLLELVDEAQFTGGENGNHGIALAAAPDGTSVAFSLENVPAGYYVLQGFQDENGNGDLDEGSMGPTEPWAIHGYKPSVWSGPKFKQSKIEVSGDVTGIVLVMND